MPTASWRRDRTHGGAHCHAFAVLNIDHRAVFENPRAMARERFRFAQQKIQRMHVARAHVQKGAFINVGAHHFPDIRAGQQLYVDARINGLETLLPRAQGLFLTLVETEVRVAEPEVRIDVVLVYTRANDARALIADPEDLLQAFLPDMFLDCIEVVADSRHDLAAVCPVPP